MLKPPFLRGLLDALLSELADLFEINLTWCRNMIWSTNFVLKTANIIPTLDTQPAAQKKDCCSSGVLRCKKRIRRACARSHALRVLLILTDGGLTFDGILAYVKRWLCYTRVRYHSRVLILPYSPGSFRGLNTWSPSIPMQNPSILRCQHAAPFYLTMLEGWQCLG